MSNKRNERGKRIWLPGSPAQLASAERAAQREMLRLGQYLMRLHIAATKNSTTAAPAA